jgi:dTDP-4-amino-4,6-dideoxygalactose transaminase
MSVMAKIPLYRPQDAMAHGMLDDILEEIRKVFESGWLTMGPKTDEFEKAYASYIGCKYAVATNSCSSALYLALNSLRLKKKDRVVVPILTSVATANVIRWSGAEPAFCDVAEDGEIDPSELERLLELDDRIKCVVPVHLYGFPCDIRRINRLAKEHKLWMVEDCAQSHGATVDDQKVGSFGEAGCFSFYATKNMTTGEGGILVTSNKEVRNKALLVRNQGQTKTPKQKAAAWKYDVVDLGFNFRMGEIEAAIGLKQLATTDSMIQLRRELARMYKEELDKIDGIEMLQDPESGGSRHGVYHLLVVKVEKPYPLTRNKLYLRLKKNGIITGVHFPPLHYFTYYKNTTNYKKGDFPCGERLYSKILSLPIYPFMKRQEFQKIIRVLKMKVP